MATKCFFSGVLATGILCMTPLSLSAGYPSGYYDTLEGKCGVELMKAVKALGAGHKVISYGDRTWEAFKSTDVRTIDGVDYWWDMYSTNLVEATGHEGLNIEHSVANSWWGKTRNDAFKDIVHLNPADKDANNRKSNYPLCELSSVTWDNGVTYVGTPMSGQGGGSSKGYEPADEYKGDFARVFMYIFCTYDDIEWKDNTAWMYDTSSELVFRPWAQSLLLNWSASDAVSQKERSRNDGVYKEQRNRNPFIDFPDIAEHIWGDKKTVPFSLNGASGGGDPVNPGDADTYEWLVSTHTELTDGWTLENVSMDTNLTYVWDWKNFGDNYYLNGSGYKGAAYAAEAYAWSPVVDLSNCSKATFSFEHAAKFQTTLRQYCRVAVREEYSGEVTLIDIPRWPDKRSWKFVSSGDIDLTEFSGKKIRVGFLYKSDATGADTWEINNASLKLIRENSGVENVPALEPEDDSVLVEVWGNNIFAPEGAVIYDLNGRKVSGDNLARGVYIVVKPSFRKAVKVMVK